MRNPLIFLLLSLLLHLPVLLLVIHETEQGKETEQIIPIEIIPKEVPRTPETPSLKPEPQQQPRQQPAPKPAAPTEPVPRTPEPEKPLPVKPLPKPSPEGPDDGDTGEPGPAEQPAGRPPIIPKQISPDSPLSKPLTPDEFLSMPRNSDLYGPDRSIRDIIKDYLSQQQLPPGEDSVTFNNMSAKYDSYFYKFARALYGIWRYPPDAARRGEAGIVRITFNINKDGSITDINVLESSGYPALDREALRTLKSMPRVELPDPYELNVLHVNGYFIYTLTGEYRLY